jgi:magnesium transporter
MPKPPASRSSKLGLPPGTPVYIGEAKAEGLKITVLDYDEAGSHEREIGDLNQCFALTGAPGVTWISVAGVHDVDILQQLGECFHLHPLVLEDISNTEQRPKLEDYDDYLFIVAKACDKSQDAAEIVSEQVSIILGPSFVISFEEREGDLFEPIKARIRNGRGQMRKLGADYLAYSLIDAVVDRYFVVLEALGETIENLEDELVSSPTTATLQVIHHLKTEMIELRKAVWPMREMILTLSREQSGLIRETTGVYLRDVSDHAIEVIDTMETYRDIVSSMLDIYLSSISNRMNQIMKVLTIIATIFIPLTFLTGVYGMNFKHMPELGLPWSYPALWGVMLVAAGGMLLYFRKRKWL